MTKVEWKWNIPNALSFFRILLVPVIAVAYLMSEQHPALLYVAGAALVLSGLSDSLDGIIARKFNQITDLGKLLDPVADKLTQVTVIVCITVRHPELLPLLILCAIKEVSQLVGGWLMLRRGQKVQGALWFGKVSTLLFYGAMAAIVLFPTMPHWLFIGLNVLVGLAMLVSFAGYFKLYMERRGEVHSKEEPSSDTP